jgi:CO dehydrogenase nickel-insertion accessory protein CooC1
LNLGGHHGEHFHRTTTDAFTGRLREAGIKNFWFILNKIGSQEVEAMIMGKLLDLRGKIIGSISYDQELIKAGLSGNALGECNAMEEVERIVERLEQVVSFQEKTKK